jgi:hypothetical protein
MPKSTYDAKELSMISRRLGAAPAEFPQKRDVLADNGDHGPMSQQDAVGSHGHEMYPQEFVRLVGCHGSRKTRGSVMTQSGSQRRRKAAITRCE